MARLWEEAELEAMAGDPSRVLMADDLAAMLKMETELCQKAKDAKPEVTCVAHAGHFEEGFTLSDCKHHCERAEASDSFADPVSPGFWL